MNENHCNINSERIGNILMHEELNFLKIQGEENIIPTQKMKNLLK